MAYAVSLSAVPTIGVAGSDDLFPVRRIYAVGRNYADHAAETGLGGDDGPKPGFSLKPADSICTSREVAYPPATSHLDPEIEMVVAIGKGGSDIAERDATAHIFGYAIGLDMIRRDVMHECIKNQHSWDLCKSFDGASPCGPIMPAQQIGHPDHGQIRLTVNGEVRQSGNIQDLIWKPAEIIARLSAFSRLEPGDIIFTGTPKGPAPVSRGDVIEGYLESVSDITVTMV